MSYKLKNIETENITASETGAITIGSNTVNTSINQYGLTTQGVVQATNSQGTAQSRFNNFNMYSDNGLTMTGTFNALGTASLKNYYLWNVNPREFAISATDKSIKTTGNITCNQINTPLLTNTVGRDPMVQLGAPLDANSNSITNISLLRTSALSVNNELVKATVRPTYEYWVAVNGSNFGDINLGSQTDPFLTIGKAIEICESFTDGIPRVIHVTAGSYSESITLHKSRISIQGEGTSAHPDIGTSIYGNITVNLTSGNSDLNNNNIYISGFLVNGVIEDNTVTIDNVTFPHRVFITNCQLYGDSRALYMHPEGDYRAFVSTCTISNDNVSATLPLVECNSNSTGMVTFNNNQITAKGTAQNVFKLSGSCRIDTFAQNVLTSDCTGNNQALAIFHHGSSATISLGQNAFIYSTQGNGNLKRNTDTASAVYMASGSGSLVIISNFVSLGGLSTNDKAFYAPYITGLPNGSIIMHANNYSSSSLINPSANSISGTTNGTKFLMSACA